MQKQKHFTRKIVIHVCNKCFPKLFPVKMRAKIHCQAIILNKQFVIHLN